MIYMLYAVIRFEESLSWLSICVDPSFEHLQAIPVLSPTAALSISQLLLKLFPLRQPLLCRHATDALAALLGSPNVRIGPTGMADVLSSVLAAQSAWDRRDADTLLSVIKLLEDGYIR